MNFESISLHQKKDLSIDKSFFNEIRLTACEILLCNMKWLRCEIIALQILKAYFISLKAWAFNFAIHASELFNIEQSEIFH